MVKRETHPQSVPHEEQKPGLKKERKTEVKNTNESRLFNGGDDVFEW